jgi:rare lipoprotein A
MARVLFLLGLTLLCGVGFSREAAAELGHASWYALTSPTASGEMCDPDGLTAAHRTLPFGTTVEVENLANGKLVVVRINDRGPFVGDRIIDLTRAAAARLGFLADGIAWVRVRLAPAPGSVTFTEQIGPSGSATAPRRGFPF